MHGPARTSRVASCECMKPAARPAAPHRHAAPRRARACVEGVEGAGVVNWDCKVEMQSGDAKWECEVRDVIMKYENNENQCSKICAKPLACEGGAGDELGDEGVHGGAIARVGRERGHEAHLRGARGALLRSEPLYVRY